MVFRQHIVEVRGLPTATTSLCLLAGVPPPWAPPSAPATPPPDRVTSVGNRLRPHHGGTHERRIRRASARHYSPHRRPPRQADLLGPGPHRGVVPQMVAALPRGRCRLPVRPDPCAPPPLPTPRRLQPPAAPAPRYSLIGAAAFLAELKGLDIRPLPSPRTVERVLQRHGLTAPPERLPRLLPRQVYPAPPAQRSNQLHEVDPVGPIYLKGRRHRYYILVCKDAFDGAVCLRLATSRRMTDVLTFLGEVWKSSWLRE